MSADVGLERIAEGLLLAATVDLRLLSLSDKCARVVALQRLSHQLDAELTRTAHDWEQSGTWGTDGSRSSTARLSRDGHVSERTARAVLSRGDRLASAVYVAAAFAAGDLSADQVDLLLAAAISREPFFTRDEETLVEQATRLRFAELRTTLAYWKARVDAELGRDGPEPKIDPELKLVTGPDGFVYLDGQLDPIGGKLVTTTIDKLVAELTKADKDAGRPPRLKTDLQAAALVEMARRAMAAPAGQPARILMNIACGDDEFKRLCELSNGVVIRPARSSRTCPTWTSARSSTTRPTAPSPPPRDARSSARCATSSKSATATANTPPAATSPPTAATSTTSNPGRHPPARTMVASCASSTTASNRSGRHHPNEVANGRLDRRSSSGGLRSSTIVASGVEEAAMMSARRRTSSRNWEFSGRLFGDEQTVRAHLDDFLAVMRELVDRLATIGDAVVLTVGSSDDIFSEKRWRQGAERVRQARSRFIGIERDIYPGRRDYGSSSRRFDVDRVRCWLWLGDDVIGTELDFEIESREDAPIGIDECVDCFVRLASAGGFAQGRASVPPEDGFDFPDFGFDPVAYSTVSYTPAALRRYLRDMAWGTWITADHVTALGGVEQVYDEAPAARALVAGDGVWLQLTKAPGPRYGDRFTLMEHYLAPVIPSADDLRRLGGRLPGEDAEPEIDRSAADAYVDFAGKAVSIRGWNRFARRWRSR